DDDGLFFAGLLVPQLLRHRPKNVKRSLALLHGAADFLPLAEPSGVRVAVQDHEELIPPGPLAGVRAVLAANKDLRQRLRKGIGVLEYADDALRCCLRLTKKAHRVNPTGLSASAASW